MTPPALIDQNDYTEYIQNLSELACVSLVKFFSIPCSVWNSTWRHSHFLIALTLSAVMGNAWGSISVYTLCIYVNIYTHEDKYVYICVYLYTVSLSTVHLVPLFAARENISLCDIMRMKPSPTGSSHGNFTWVIAEYQKVRSSLGNHVWIFTSNNQNMLPKNKRLSQSEQLAISAISTCCLRSSTAN